MPELIITEENWREQVGDGYAVDFGGDRRILSCLPRRTVYGACPGALPVVEAVDLIPRADWDFRIKLMEGAWLHDLVATVIPCKDQNGLGYCWSYGTTLAIEANRVKQGNSHIELAPESLGRAVNWQNEGAAVDDALAVARDFGPCAQSYLDKAHSLNTAKWKPGWEANCGLHKLTEWFDLSVPGKTFEACMTMALLAVPYSAGFSWWGHLVCGGFKARKAASGRYEILYRNSWGPTYGEDGFFWMREGKGQNLAEPDIGAFAPRATVPSQT